MAKFKEMFLESKSSELTLDAFKKLNKKEQEQETLRIVKKYDEGGSKSSALTKDEFKVYQYIIKKEFGN